MTQLKEELAVALHEQGKKQEELDKMATTYEKVQTLNMTYFNTNKVNCLFCRQLLIYKKKQKSLTKRKLISGKSFLVPWARILRYHISSQMILFFLKKNF